MRAAGAATTFQRAFTAAGKIRRKRTDRKRVPLRFDAVPCVVPASAFSHLRLHEHTIDPSYQPLQGIRSYLDSDRIFKVVCFFSVAREGHISNRQRNYIGSLEKVDATLRPR
ncbi:Hypothetical protein CINCED_3A018161 [Cinara cedri]|uniref:Uncharacterized protein n=1 Tax=Cinara cedri TaxID=506608 RepID=A0A5E4MEA5_9HEMI|nr:Hypothetical protein CINCED_3A018161 [Cinara cedri]